MSTMKFPKLPKLFEIHRPKSEPVLASEPTPELQYDIPVLESTLVEEPTPTSKRKSRAKPKVTTEVRQQVVALIGSREFKNRDIIYKILDDLFGKHDKTQTTFISGKAKGADTLCEDWAKSRGMLFKPYPIEKGEEPFDRNGRVAAAATAIVAFVPKDKFKSGTWNTISQFKKMDKSMYVVFDEFGKGWDRTWKQKD